MLAATAVRSCRLQPSCILLLRDEPLAADRRRVLSKQPFPEWDRHLWKRTIRDVLSWKRLLVHSRAHVAGIDQYGGHTVGVKFGCQCAREQFQRRLGRAVGSPAGVGASRSVARDVDD